MQNMLTRVAGLLSILLWVACSSEFEPQSLVSKFRIIAVKAEPPSGMPGEEVSLSPLMSDSKTGQPPLLVWLICYPHPGQTGTQCLEEGGAQVAGFGNNFQFLLPEIGEKEENKEIYVILLACIGNLKEPDFKKLDYNFCDGEENDIAIKTVTVNKEKNNHNPEINSVHFIEQDGTSHTPDENNFLALNCQNQCEELIVQLKLTPESLEKYEENRFGETSTKYEDLFISWFATAGKFSKARTYESEYFDSGEITEIREVLYYETKWTPPEDGGNVHFYFVAYDQRGGVDFIKFDASITISE